MNRQTKLTLHEPITFDILHEPITFDIFDMGDYHGLLKQVHCHAKYCTISRIFQLSAVIPCKRVLSLTQPQKKILLMFVVNDLGISVTSLRLTGSMPFRV